MKATNAAIIGSGNIGTDLMMKVLRTSGTLNLSALVGIDPDSEGLARASRLGVATTPEGLQGLLDMPEWDDIEILFDATSAKAHPEHDAVVRRFPNKRIIDLTPAAIGPYVVPTVNLDLHAGVQNLNMVSCGGQATIPIVAAVSRVASVHYGEIVSTIASKSAGAGTRANIDEFTRTTARGIEEVGGAARGKAIIILNPAEPPLVMRNTVFTLSDPADSAAVRTEIERMVASVQQYVPGYTLHQDVQFEEIPTENPVFIEGLGHCHGLKTTTFLRVRGAGHYLPAYAGNLDIMTSAALATAEKLAHLIAAST